MTGSLVYVYAIADEPLNTTALGIDERPVRWVTAAGLSAAASDVPAADFDEQPLNEHVRDMAWLGPRAVAHQEVNSRLHQVAAALLPLAFGTVFRDDERLRELLLTERQAFQRRLDSVRGAAEWVIALYLLREPDAETVERRSPAIQAARAQIEASSPGRAHLLRRRLAQLQRDEARRQQGEAAAEVFERLRVVSRSAYAEPLPRDTVERPLLRASVLVHRDQEEAFLDETERLRARWPEPTYRLLLTGPWPPYRFGGLETLE